MKKYHIQTIFFLIIFILCINNIYSVENDIVLVGSQTNNSFSCELYNANPYADGGVGWYTSFTLPETCVVSISILDTSLIPVYNFPSQNLCDGDYNIFWNHLDNKGKTVQSGLYYFEILAKSIKPETFNEYSCRFKFLALTIK